MAHDIITLEPAKAGETLLQMQFSLREFNETVYGIGTLLQSTAAITYSEPLIKTLGRSAYDLNELGHGVNAGIYAFSHAFVQVIQQWKKTDAQQASEVSFEKPHFKEFRIAHHASEKLQVGIAEMRRVIEIINVDDFYLRNCFDGMDTIMTDSTHYWRGHSADQTRHNWKRHIEPLMLKTVSTISDVVTIMTDELEAFIKRDASNFPGNW